jgi:hypothetical protein
MDQALPDIKIPTPPYTAFQSLKTIITDFKNHGITNRIDETIFTDFSGAVRRQIMTALRYLDLIQGDNRPTEGLNEVVEACGTYAWGPTLLKVLQRAYAPLFELNLENATPGQFSNRFRREYPGSEDVQRKSVAFFLNAVRDTSFPISKFIMPNRKQHNGSKKIKSCTKRRTEQAISAVERF